MKIEVRTGEYIFLHFEEDDWETKEDRVREFIEIIKKHIGNYQQKKGDKTVINEYGYDYDDDEDVKTWIISDTPKNRQIINETKKILMDDKYQIKLFQEKDETPIDKSK